MVQIGNMDTGTRKNMGFLLWLMINFVLVGTIEAKGIGKFVYENCGPPFKLTITPNPPKFRQAVNVTVEFVAAHDLVAGMVVAYLSIWPYHYKNVYCADDKTIDAKGCYITKGEKRVISGSVWIDENFKEAGYAANATLYNEKNQLLICIRARIQT